MKIDCISRADAIRVASGYCHPSNVAKELAKLPSVTPQEPFINKPCVSSRVCEHDKHKVLDKIRAEITDCLKALDDIEKSGLNIYLPNEISYMRLTYQQCLRFIDKYKAESEVEDGNVDW